MLTAFFLEATFLGILLFGWNKVPPAPVPPEDIIEKTSMKYREALVKLTGEDVQ